MNFPSLGIQLSAVRKASNCARRQARDRATRSAADDDEHNLPRLHRRPHQHWKNIHPRWHRPSRPPPSALHRTSPPPTRAGCGLTTLAQEIQARVGLRRNFLPSNAEDGALYKLTRRPTASSLLQVLPPPNSPVPRKSTTIWLDRSWMRLLRRDRTSSCRGHLQRVI